MRKLFFMLLFLAATILNCQALTVNNTAGGLASAVDDVNITVLKVTGTMDARDFLFITESLTELTSLDDWLRRICWLLPVAQHHLARVGSLYR